jgi:hypothetical protein
MKFRRRPPSLRTVWPMVSDFMAAVAGIGGLFGSGTTFISPFQTNEAEKYFIRINLVENGNFTWKPSNLNCMEREEFKVKAKQTIDDLFAHIDKLEAKMNKAKADSKEKYKTEIDELKLKGAELQDKYNKLEDTVEDKWEEVKAAFQESIPSFKKGFSVLGGIFRKKQG